MRSIALDSAFGSAIVVVLNRRLALPATPLMSHQAGHLVLGDLDAVLGQL
jgi:hypothetical protein